MEEEREEGRGLVEWFVDLAVALDRRLRLLDWALQRSFDGPSKKLFRIDGYSPIAFLVFAAAIVYQILGPSLGWRDWVSVVSLLAATPIVLYVLVFLLGERRLWLAQIGTALLVSLAVFVAFADPDAREAGEALYRHILAPALWVLIAAVFVAKWLSARMFRAEQGRFKPYLKEAELFVKPQPPTGVTSGSVFWSFVTVPVRHPLQLLLFPAFVVLVVQDERLMWQWALALLAVSWIALALAGLHDRLRFMINLPRRVFFVGGQLVISVLIILLAFGRIVGFSYVADLLDSTAGPVVAVLVFAGYFTFWFYEYWINRLLCEALLGTLDGPADRPAGRIDYPVNPSVIPEGIRVKPDQRAIQVHGAERFVAVGRHKDKGEGEGDTVFQYYGKIELFQRIFEWAVGHGMLTRQEASRLRYALERKIQYYFLALNALLVVAAIAAWYVLSGLPQLPELCIAPAGGAQAGSGCVAATPADARNSGRVDLAGLVQREGDAPERVLLVAASGGGTRAALYAASVLRGLEELDALRDVVLTSGVSGGSAALAYFAAHRETLIGGTDTDWRRYMEVMSAAFIRDVLRGVGEWRLAKGTRLGTLLAESFERRMQPPQEHATLARRAPAFIFNTALGGHLHRTSPADAPLAQWAAENRRLTRADGAGGRLVLTNLDSRDYFPAEGSSVLPDAHFRYVVVNEPNAPLATAAALSANFPPVFSNAAVDAQERDRYWVTDGGAADNRGLVSLLYALRHALDKLADADRDGPLPEIHVIVAEASKQSFDFKQDRGYGARTGAAEKFASQLSDRLWQEIVARYRVLGGGAEGIHLHYLAMPLTLRARGGLGTHWILPNTVKLKDAVVPDPEQSTPPSVTLSGEQVREIIYSLHRAQQEPCKHVDEMPSPGLQSVWRWICKDPVHAREWRKLKTALGR